MFNKKSNFMRAAAAIMLALAALFAFGFFISFAHGETTAKHKNAFGAVVEYTNPYVYMFGQAHKVDVFNCGKDWLCTNVEFQPYMRPLLYPENVLFCGNVAFAFEDQKPVVVTFDRQASHNAGGIGCHKFEAAYALEAE